MSALEEVRDLAEAVVRRRSLTLWDVEMTGRPGQALIRVFVDADGGVDLDTVAKVSEELSRGLDLRDPIAGRYTLEVSSPGLERNLRAPEHFEASLGMKVVVKTTKQLVEGTNRIDGILREAAPDGAVIDPSDGPEIRVPYDVIKSARTVFEWK